MRRRATSSGTDKLDRRVGGRDRVERARLGRGPGIPVEHVPARPDAGQRVAHDIVHQFVRDEITAVEVGAHAVPALGG